METKIKTNQIDYDFNGGGGSLGEFVVTEDKYEKYKIDMGADGDALDISRMLEEEELSYATINMNQYNGLFDGAHLEGYGIVIKNSSFILFGSPEYGHACGRALELVESYITFKDIDNIVVENGVSPEWGMIDIHGGALTFENCGINAAFSVSKSFIKCLDENTEITVKNCDVNIHENSDEQDDPDTSFNFVQVCSNFCRIKLLNNDSLRIANDNGEADDSQIQNNFIVTDENITARLDIKNNIIKMEGHGFNNNRAININLDNTDCDIINNYLNGSVEIRPESVNTISTRLEGGSFTLEGGEKIFADINPNVICYEATQTINISSTQDFENAISNETLREVNARMNNFINNSINGSIEGYSIFITGAAADFITKNAFISNRYFSLEDPEENSVIMFSDGYWKAMTLQELKDALDNI